MKKNFKKFLTVALASVMTLGALIGSPVKAEAAEATAKFSLADADWNPQVWGDQDSAQTTVTGAGSYSMEIVPTDGATFEGATVFVVDIEYGDKEVLTAQNYRVSELKLTVDDAEFPIDTTKIVTGDIEEKGNFRIELFNAYGSTAVGEKYDATVSPFDPATLKASKSVKVDFTLVETDEPAYDAEGKSTKYVGLAGNSGTVSDSEDTETDVPEFDPAGKYNAYFGLQSPSWTYRDPWNSDNGIGSENWGQWVKNNDAGTTYGTVTDAKVEGNGTYTVSLTGFDNVFADEFANNVDGLDKFRILMITTDIPLSDSVKVTDVKLIMDGKTIETYEEAFLDPDETDYVKILIQNEWNEDLKDTLPYYPAPTKSIEFQFTISGFSYDNPDAKADDATDTTDTEKTDDPSDDNTSTDDADKENNNILPIIIGVVAVVIIAGVVVVVMKKKK